jgi:hypothetical protein
MIEFEKDRTIELTPKRDLCKSNYALKDLALKYYDTLEPIVNDLASKCIGGEETSLVFAMGKITIKLR